MRHQPLNIFNDLRDQIDTSGAIVDSQPVESITVTGQRPINYWPWIILGVLVVAALIYYGSKRK